MKEAPHLGQGFGEVELLGFHPYLFNEPSSSV
jgi:hypothetical protein